MPIDFPANPVNGQIYESFKYDSATSSWTSQSAAQILSSRVTAIEKRVPAGVLHQWTLDSAPAGYLFCSGQAVSRSQYKSLFEAIGTVYGSGDGSTTFNLPDLQGRVPVGKSTSGTFSALNNKGGAETVTLDLTQLPPHTHTQDAHNHTQNSHNHTQGQHLHDIPGGYVSPTQQSGFTNSPLRTGGDFGFRYISQNTLGATATNNATTATNNATTATNQNTGGGQAHNNLQPYVVLNYIIKT